MIIRQRIAIFPSAILLLSCLAALARADTLSLGDNRYEGVINGIRGGKASITIRGTERQYELSDITAISIDDLPRLADAESVRAPDPKKAVAAYKAVIPTINKPELKLLIQWRAIDAYDRDGQWSEAVNLFLEVYRAAPADAVWNTRPSRFPAAGSKMLDDSAARVTAALRDAKSDDVKKNLRKFLLDIHTKAGNIQEAQRIAREIDTGIAEPPITAAAPETAPASNPATAALAEITAALAASDFDKVITLANQQLATAAGPAAVQLLALKAQALEAQNKPREAAATWLRIFAHYPSSPSAPAALLNAARLQKKLNDPAAAQVLLTELTQKYPASKEAALAPNQ
jgi:hypothetical protein